MILRQATIKYAGYDPDGLPPKSTKRVCISCDRCGSVRWVPKQGYRKLCNSCKQIGKLNPMFDVHRYGKAAPFYDHKCSDETKIKMSKAAINKPKSDKAKSNMSKNHADFGRENNPNWKGGLPLRTHVLSKAQCRKINLRFSGSEFHHLSKSIGIYIPMELHRHISHNLKTDQGMKEMSILSFQFIKGEL